MRNRHLFLLDAAALIASPVVAFIVRFEDIGWLGHNLRMVIPYILLAAPARLFVFYNLGMYRRLWRHASIGELRQILVAGGVAGVFAAVIGFWIMPATQVSATRVPFSVVFIDAFLATAAIALPRLLARTIRLRNPRHRHTVATRLALIVGAGDTGKLVAKELIANPRLGFEPIGFVDDDLTKQRHMLLELPIMGTLSAIKGIVEQHGVSELIIAMPSAHGDVIRKVVRAGLDCGIPTLTVPSLPELISAKTNGTSLREVEIQDLLRREPIETDLAAVAELATGETVLITGAGGSIGSELCRQIARLAPARLVVLGHGENSIFDVLHELTEAFPDIAIMPVIADVRDRKRVAAVFDIS